MLQAHWMSELSDLIILKEWAQLLETAMVTMRGPPEKS